MTQQISNCFLPYKDIHYGESVFIIGTGPSYGLFEESDLANQSLVKKIGCNVLVYSNARPLDYYFIGDLFCGGPGLSLSFDQNPKPFLNYQPLVEKFCRKSIESRLASGIPAFKVYHTTRDKRKHKYTSKEPAHFPVDIVNEPINGIASISFDMMQFALYCGFKTIFLVGHDCNFNGTDKDGNRTTHFHQDISTRWPTSDPGPAHRLIRSWQWIKAHIDSNIPDVKVFSINPISLDIFPEISIDRVMEVSSERKLLF